jgi:hypothetical protein
MYHVEYDMLEFWFNAAWRPCGTDPARHVCRYPATVTTTMEVKSR